MIELPPCKIVTVIGPVASGKTHLLRTWLAKTNRFVCFDSTGEMLDLPNAVQIWASPKKLWEHINTTPYFFRVAYVPGPDLREDFSWCVKALWQFDAVKLLAVDECHRIFANQDIEDSTEMLLRFARHAKLGLVCMSQRFADVHKLLLSSSRFVIIFRTRAARDYEAVRAMYGNDVAEKVANLRPLMHDDSTGVTSQVPQCMVISQEGNARIFDFEQDTFLDDQSDDGTLSGNPDSSEGKVPSEEGSSDVDVHNEPAPEEL